MQKVTQEQPSSNLCLNPRLLKIARLLPKSQVVADIGTDHAYIPVWAILNKASQFAIASDINKGPLDRALQNVFAFGLSDKISLRLGAGLSTISPGEADTIVIAGMGGMLVSNILSDAKNTVLSAKTLILQPMTAAKELREYLVQNGFCISEEHLVAEDEKIYNIFIVSIGAPVREYTERELILGKDLDKTSPELFDRHRQNILKKHKKRAEGLKKSGREENKESLDEIERLLELLK